METTKKILRSIIKESFVNIEYGDEVFNRYGCVHSNGHAWNWTKLHEASIEDLLYIINKLQTKDVYEMAVKIAKFNNTNEIDTNNNIENYEDLKSLMEEDSFKQDMLKIYMESPMTQYINKKYFFDLFFDTFAFFNLKSTYVVETNVVEVYITGKKHCENTYIIRFGKFENEEDIMKLEYDNDRLDVCLSFLDTIREIYTEEEMIDLFIHVFNYVIDCCQ